MHPSFLNSNVICLFVYVCAGPLLLLRRFSSRGGGGPVTKSCPTLRPHGPQAHQASLVLLHLPEFLELMSIESAMPCNHLILCRPCLLLVAVSKGCAGFSLQWLPLWFTGAQYLLHLGLDAPQHVGSSQNRDRTLVSCIGRQVLYHCATREAPFASPLFYGCLPKKCWDPSVSKGAIPVFRELTF